MSEPFLDFDRDVNLPVSGRTPRARHASHSGAQFAVLRRGEKTRQYLELLRSVGPLSDQEAAKMMGLQHTSINSIRNGCGDLVEDSGTWEETAWRTKRVRWQRRAMLTQETP